MKYVPDFVDILLALGVYVFSAGILYIVRQVDDDIKGCDLYHLWKYCGILSSITAVALFFAGRELSAGKQLCLLILAVYLVVCSVMDILLCQVNDFMQYLGVLGAGIWVYLQKPDSALGISIILFAILQYSLFIKMYGKADGMAFSICAVFLAGLGVDLEGYLYHMAICFFFLAMVQGVRGNISLKGNLKKAVALYPYIAVSFLLIFLVFVKLKSS